ncbi:MAG: hypothetical protein KY439_04740 [Actinobacteria bacterium]|nr:hypothetical protein [Actinomycetota bacterium]
MSGPEGAGRDAARRGRLQARPSTPAGQAPVGLQPLGLERDRGGLVFVPSRHRVDEPLPVVVMLHGAGGNAMGGLGPFLDRAEEAGVILLAPDSRGRTWDVLLGGYGPDVAFVDRALHQTFGRYAVDAHHVAVEGFSDGASYALGLGLANGDLFQRVIAFSPGFAPQSAPEGRPSVFVSHGVADNVLPIDRCSRRIVPALRDRGYDVRYREFAGGHDIPAAISEEAFAWFQDLERR